MIRALSFRGRLTVAWAVAFGVLLIGVQLATYLGYARFARGELDRHLITLTATEVASGTDAYGVHLHDLAQMDVGGSTKVAQVLDASGKLFLRAKSAPAEPLLSPAEVERVLAGERVLVTRELAPHGLRVTGLEAREGETRYVFVVGLALDGVDNALANLARLLVASSIVGLVVTALLGWWLASRALAPIDRITAGAFEIARGEFSRRLETPAHQDEIGRMTQRLNAMLDSLERALLANRRFAADASHELRGPLTVLRSQIDVTLMREREGGEYRETLEDMRTTATEMSTLVDGLTLLVRCRESSSELALECVPLRALVARSLERHADRARRASVTCELDVPAELLVRADERLLERTLDNLIANAIHYNRPGGGVRIFARADALQSRLYVRDTGVGIPREQWESVFAPFFRLDAARSRHSGGVGLGLSIAREIAEILGGSLSIVESSPAGTTFELVLVRAEVPCPEPADGR